MAVSEISRGRPRVLINLAALVVIIAGLKAAASIVVLVLVAAFISIIAAPLVLWLRERRVPSGLAVVIVVLAVIGVFAVAGALVGTSVNAFVRRIPSYRASLNEQAGQFLTWLREKGIAQDVLDNLNLFEPGSIMSLLGNAFTAIGGVLGNSLVIIIMVSFILLEVSGFRGKLQAAFGETTQSVERFKEIARNVERYLGLKTVVSAATGVGAGIWVAAVGLDFPLLWGLLAFILNYIPTFGSLIAAIPPVLLALVQLGPGGAALVAAGFALVNLVMGNVVEPRLMGARLGLSPLIILCALLGWGFVLGPIGMFLAVPLTMATKIVLTTDPESRWLAVLMGPEPKRKSKPPPPKQDD